MKLFNEAGEEIKIDDLPIELVRTHPAYKAVVDESVMRRQKLQAARRTAKEDLDADEDQQVTNTQQKTQEANPPVQPLNVAEIKAELLAEVTGVLQSALPQIYAGFEERSNAKIQRAAKIKALLEQHKLPEVYSAVLSRATDDDDMAAMANELARGQQTFSPTSGGGTKPEPTSIMTSVAKRLGLPEDDSGVSPFPNTPAIGAK